MKINKIAVDVDSTLIDIMVTYCEIYNSDRSENKIKDDVDDWDFFEDWGLTIDEGVEIFGRIELQNVPVICKDVDSYLENIKNNHILDIVTNREEKFRTTLIKKLKSMDIVKEKHYRRLILVKSEIEKLKLDYDIYIDDSPKLANLVLHYPNKLQYLIDQPWNREIKETTNIIRVYNWNEISRLIL